MSSPGFSIKLPIGSPSIIPASATAVDSLASASHWACSSLAISSSDFVAPPDCAVSISNEVTTPVSPPFFGGVSWFCHGFGATSHPAAISRAMAASLSMSALIPLAPATATSTASFFPSSTTASPKMVAREAPVIRRLADLQKSSHKIIPAPEISREAARVGTLFGPPMESYNVGIFDRTLSSAQTSINPFAAVSTVMNAPLHFRSTPSLVLSVMLDMSIPKRTLKWDWLPTTHIGYLGVL
mmetsp:Transcript_329/g.788  ORF Transcript_329/g.788 Transcript_329/m.788 type:complete len:241 (-) Transcript_329:1314-2036(-)